MNTAEQLHEPPEQAARRLYSDLIFRGYGLPTLYSYSGTHWVCRFNQANGNKVIRHLHLNGQGYEKKSPPYPEGRPLYRLHEITARATEPVFVCEGEGCADALAGLGLVATTSMGGAMAASKTDWSPLMGRKVIVWPDNDVPGAGYAAQVCKAVKGDIEVIDVTDLGLQEKGDCVDWLADNPTATALDVLSLARATPQPETPAVELICGADIEPKAIDWVWREWLMAGALNLLSGSPGAGKSTIAFALAAVVSTGGKWPDGTKASLGAVVIWSGEDSIEHGIVPRLHACGADMHNVHFVPSSINEGEQSRSFDPATDMDALRAAITHLAAKGTPVRLLIIDPIVSAVAGDSHKNAEVRRDLQTLVDLAEAVGCAVLGITHFTKGTQGRDTNERVTGSVAFIAVARVGLIATKLSDEQAPTPGARAFMRGKSNYGVDTGGRYYQLDQRELPSSDPSAPVLVAQCVVWGTEIEGTAHELLKAAEGEGKQPSMVEMAALWLGEVLRDGQVASVEVQRRAVGAGFSKKTLERARHSLGVRATQTESGWAMSLPPGRKC